MAILEMIYVDFIKINQKKINMCIQEDEISSEIEDHLQGWFLNIKILEIYFKNFVSNKYLKFKIWYQKPDSLSYYKGIEVCDEY